MSNSVISAVPLSTMRLLVWFEGGTTKTYNVTDAFGITDSVTHSTVSVREDGSGITWADGTEADMAKLKSCGSTIDFVTEEKRRLLRDLGAIRRESGFSQTRLGEAAGIRQSVISRIEGCEISPQINTLLKLLAPLGKTLKIVDLDDRL
jgi:DNA-binding XRE family transcriptional regulator